MAGRTNEATSESQISLFLNFDLLLVFEKLSKLEGKVSSGERRGIVVCNSELEGDCLWWAGLKFCRLRSTVVVKDMEYSFLIDARHITSEKYLTRLIRLINKSSKETLWENRTNPSFIKQNIRGVCRFGDNLSDVKPEVVKKVKRDLQSLKVLEICAKYNLNEHFVKKIKYAKTGSQAAD